MYITSVTIENIRSIKKIAIDFNKLGDSVLITGNNGSGKSTVLKCIAMGITDEDSAASVLRSMPGEFVRKGEYEGVITINISSTNGRRYRIRTKIVSQNIFEKVFQRVYRMEDGKYKSIPQEEFPWHNIFASGYGAGLRTIGSSNYRYYVAIDALFSLFSHDTPLQNPELAIRRMIAMAEESDKKNAGKQIEKYLTQMLGKILDLNESDKVILTSSSIEVKTKEFGQNELNTLGDGYISTITWILDLFSWWMLHLKSLKKNIIKNKDISGVIIIDEIELHLHLEWQKSIMKKWYLIFPDVQFIGSTNSKAVMINTDDDRIVNL